MQKLQAIFVYTLLLTSSYIIGMEREGFSQQQMDLTNKLYKKELTPVTLIQLHKQGALINGKTPKYKAVCGRLDYHALEPLSHWVVAFHFHHKDETPYSSNAIYTTNFSNLDGKKTIKDLEIIMQLLELDAKSTKEFEEHYASLLKYNLSNSQSKAQLTQENRDKNIEILLKSKPTKIGNLPIEDIWKDTITAETHQYVDLLIQYFTPEELQIGLDYCIVNQHSILEKFGYSREHCSECLPVIVEKLIHKGADPNKQLTHLSNKIVNSWEQKLNLEILKRLCDNGAFDERTVDILERHLEDMEKEKIAILTALNQMKKNKLGYQSS